MSIREASHAGSWYTDRGDRLDRELEGWLGDAGAESEEGLIFPVKGCKAVIAPHAGYSYSGPAAAWAYKCIDPSGIKRVFILGPAHHVYMDGCALSQCTYYSTPLGNLPLDEDTISELRKTDMFKDMDYPTDCDEHSIEMHLPYVRKMFAKHDIKIVPILVGAINKEKEKNYGELLAPYLAREDTFCVISSDFCHWGSRFSYTSYYPSPPATKYDSSVGQSLSRLSSSSKPSADFPIWKSISVLDHQAMSILTLPPHTGQTAHDAFATYLSTTRNTICGRHPIGVLLGALALIDGSLTESNGQEATARPATIKWVRYEQSSQCTSPRDSSVSYASAYVVF